MTGGVHPSGMPRVREDLLDHDADQVTRWDGVRFTGIGYEEYAAGRVSSETSYRGGIQHGPAREFFADGGVRIETVWVDGVAAGEQQFDESGRLRHEEVFEHGIRVSEHSWAEDGTETGTWALSDTDPHYGRWARSRDRESGSPTGGPPATSPGRPATGSPSPHRPC